MKITVNQLDNKEIINRNTFFVNGYTFVLLRRLKRGIIFNEFKNITPLSVNLPSIGKQVVDFLTGREEYLIGGIDGVAMTLTEVVSVINKYHIAMATIEWLNSFDWNKVDIINE